ncbi:zinc finger MYM-type protein 1-like [Eupeodes corollae]|uniref:zinc finger MYM-type protein 1-like n=1 Tax=Eupeodes corollae TaxID=290404 RepID=UPI0024916474|nr:zinc finger MYM-type protein 1-like [Eupeodes corollae]
MSEESLKKKHLSGSEKRKKRLDQQNKRDEVLKKTYNLFQLGFSRQSPEIQHSPSTSTGQSSDTNAVELPSECSEQTQQDKETSTSKCADGGEDEVQILNQSIEQLGVEYQNDIGIWQNINNEIQDFWCARDPYECQNFECDFSASSRQYDDTKRFFSQSMFFRKHVSGGKIKREWLMYSPSTGKVFCFPCVLFGEEQSGSQFKTGFSDWKNATDRMQAHENNSKHQECVHTLISRRRIHGRIDTSLEISINKEREYWTQILQRLVSVIKFVSSRGLPFRGDDEILGSQHNGNYLGILELLAEYDPFLSAHLAKYGNKGKGRPSYLSSTICEELIEILGNRVLEFIVNEIIEAKYFSISVDSTPDISHTDQLTVVLRYVKSNGEVAERFLAFIPMASHKGEELAEAILKFLNKYHINIKNARGQSYDNASNMSGCYNGLQAHIKKINPLAHYVPCAAHSLNLVGVRAAECCIGAISFFGFVQTLYNFFSASTHRWGIMQNNIENGLVLKKVSFTRWCARADATKALSKGFLDFQKALQSIIEDKTQTTQTIHEARCLIKEFEKKENVIMTLFWNAILDRINAVSKSLQHPAIELTTAVDLLKSLLHFLASQRELFDEYEMQANQKTNIEYSDENQRVRKRKKYHDEGSGEEVLLNGKQKFKIETYLPILDMLYGELSRRLKAYEEINSLFGFLTDFMTKTNQEIKDACMKFIEYYSDDIEPQFTNEMVQFKFFMLQSEDAPEKSKIVDADKLLKIISDKMVQSTFPNVMIALKIYRTIEFVSNNGDRKRCSG